ncbi:16S rRNA (guanine(527)-N(7))-methyltransferase RsmG [bacterium]|nr:16S rRNA (guanine(527)-N(7))-methyltransferase RsmG [bacterium]
MKELIRKILLTVDNPAIAVSDGQLDQLNEFALNLLRYGRERGLTALQSPEDIARELIVDSLGAMPFIKSGSRIADLGSGAGIPGIPLAIVNPECSFIMIESQNRKAKWIEEQIIHLNLQTRAHALPMRIEDAAHNPNWRGKLDFITAKALTSLPSLIELALPLLKVGGCLLAYKAVKIQEELDISENALEKLHGRAEDCFLYNLDGRERNVCVIKKLKTTSKNYPRRVGVPQHNPL